VVEEVVPKNWTAPTDDESERVTLSLESQETLHKTINVTNTYEPDPIDVTVIGKKNVNGLAPPPGWVFFFTVMSGDTPVSWGRSENGVILFDKPLEIDSPGTHIFTVVENIPVTDGYDGSKAFIIDPETGEPIEYAVKYVTDPETNEQIRYIVKHIPDPETGEPIPYLVGYDLTRHTIEVTAAALTNGDLVWVETVFPQAPQTRRTALTYRAMLRNPCSSTTR
jgi:hypothetical protein